MKKQRNYRKEYDTYHGKPIQIKRRNLRNAARAKLGLKIGDPHEVDHIKPLSLGGKNDSSNLEILTKKQNRKKGNKIR